MMSEQDIAEKLAAIGFKDSEIPTVMQDVGEVIAGRALLAYLPTLPESELARIKALQPEEFQQYIAEHADSLPPFSQAEFDEIHDGAWRDYFKSIAS